MAIEARLLSSLVILVPSALWSGSGLALDPSEADYDLKLLGKYLFFDKISVPTRMSCSSCHDPRWGWTNPNTHINATQVGVTGADPHTQGTLKPPANAYVSDIQPFGECPPGVGAPGPDALCGGNFWDGRAEGRSGGPLFGGATKHVGTEVFQGDAALESAYEKYLGPVADQAINPMPNPVEQNIERQAVCEHVQSQAYAALYETVWGEPLDCSDSPVPIQAADVVAESEFDVSFKRFALALSAYQHSVEVNSFSSRRDWALARDADGEFPLDDFTDQENLGHDLFYSFGNGGRCAACHRDNPRDDGTEPGQLYTDNSYRNIGVPKNPELPASRLLGNHTGDPDHDGLVKVPGLRNVAKKPADGLVKAYTHNGYFKSLESLVHFYNTAEAKPRCEDLFPGVVEFPEEFALANDCWPAPEEENGSVRGGFLVGDIGLTPEEEAAIVAYLKTFSDLETPRAPRPFSPGRNPPGQRGR